ncbi:MAG: preprotein translocase subunit YajC, partial [Alphaproteobacteria bacterium]|nr:preprotein translocase subunit YajC [Alphaproteobacteria bacterium]
MLFISKAFATSEEDIQLEALAGMPSAGEAIMGQVGMILILVILFYVLLIMPQQRRFKEHSKMLDKLKKGDKVITGGGLIGKVEKIIDEKEILIDLGNGLKVTALRSTIG